ncbi:Vacuolar protein sorting-associated protein 37A [Lamellibrachia satsuma]|nr:Vacuolar protein sorting-associated protein 37A [Lamellibrachia satsuma]
MSGRSRDSNLPPPTALQTQREAQIQQLKIFNQNVSEIQRDVEYLVKCTIHATTISLHIALPAEFPQEKPLVRVSPPLTHPWVNEQMLVTGCPGINNFMVHSDLGKVTREIVEEFRRRSPILHVQPTVPVTRYPFPISIGRFPSHRSSFRLPWLLETQPVDGDVGQQPLWT